jgi:cobalamin-dependent methionine synthase I
MGLCVTLTIYSEAAMVKFLNLIAAEPDISRVALVSLVAVVSVVVAALAMLVATAVSPVLAMRWFSFLSEGG